MCWYTEMPLVPTDSPTPTCSVLPHAVWPCSGVTANSCPLVPAAPVRLAAWSTMPFVGETRSSKAKSRLTPGRVGPVITEAAVPSKCWPTAMPNGVSSLPLMVMVSVFELLAPPASVAM
ncbi:hypothetical protein FQZ97_1080650 [compost metagenome]